MSSCTGGNGGEGGVQEGGGSRGRAGEVVAGREGGGGAEGGGGGETASLIVFRWLQFHAAPAIYAICQLCKYTTSVDIKKTRFKKLVTHAEPHASAVRLVERAENSAI